jgi:cellulose synthase/poly-beta-1,6-N-acetylglucosamine synthase-like glycosyltransferase
MLFLIFWSYCGYILLLFVFSTLNPRESDQELKTTNLLRIAILIPCHNEESYVKQKIDNLKELDYTQDKLEIFFLNGLSTDNTSKEIIHHIADLPNWHLVETGCKGKINQLNYGLSRISDDVNIIVSTDMDAMLMPDVLIKFANEFNSDDRVAVVGANISPNKCLPIEERYWSDQNLMRRLESMVFTSTIVVAPCYAFRASLIERFPKDCVADDIYTAFKANTEGYFTRYVASARGTETRTPDTFQDFFRHKFRKGNAFLIELFRFFYRLPYMSGWWKTIYLTKFLQLAVVPWVLPYFLLSSISLSLSGWGLMQIVLFGFIFLGVSIVITSVLMNKLRNIYLNTQKMKKRSIVLPFITCNLILILVGLSYPFYRQSSSYARIGNKDNSEHSIPSL